MPTNTEGDLSSENVEHSLARLARYAVEEFVARGVVIPPPGDLTAEMDRRAAAFVSIKKRGELRGCIGTTEPTKGNVAEEIIANAISSASRDPRFPAVRHDELPWLSYSVDVLTVPEPVTDASELDPVRYGVIVVRGGRRGLLLPDLEGIRSAAQQVELACYKAGIMPGEAIEILRFEVERYR